MDDVGLCDVEGRERYSPADVAGAFSRALGRPVEVDVTPRDRWIGALRALGFLEAAAQSYARMTAVSIDGGFAMPDDPIRGETTLDAYIRDVVARS